MAKYLNQEGVQLIVNDYNNKLSVKADKSELSVYATKEELQNIDIPEVNLSNYATKAEVEAAVAAVPQYDDEEIRDLIAALEGEVSGLYHFKGSVANLAELEAIQNPQVGDTYNIADTGMNAAWTADGVWDQFGSVADLTDYLQKKDVEALTRTEVNSILFAGKTAVVTDVESIQAVLSNSQPAVEITVNDNLELEETVTIPAGKKVTLNLGNNSVESGATQAFVADGAGAELVLNGGSVESDSNGTVYANNGGKVTINGTTIVSTNNNCVCARGAGSEVVVNSGDLTGQEYGILAIDAGDVVVNGGNIKGLDNFGIGGNGTAGRGGSTVTINGGVIEGHIQAAGYQAVAIYWPNTGTLNFNGGTIITDGAGIVQRGGTVNIGADAVIQASDTPTDRETGTAGDGRNVVGRYAVVYDYNSKYPAYESMALNIAAGATLSSVDGDLSILPADAPNVVDNR